VALKKQPSRAEINKDVRRVLVRHSVDTGKLAFSCSGKLLTMTGYLCKSDGNELDMKMLEVIVQDLARMGLQLYCDLENWSVSNGTVSKKASKDAEAIAQAPATKPS
jgi:hypothetical protein